MKRHFPLRHFGAVLRKLKKTSVEVSVRFTSFLRFVESSNVRNGGRFANDSNAISMGGRELFKRVSYNEPRNIYATVETEIECERAVEFLSGRGTGSAVQKIRFTR